jgi:hypothetical protein
LVGGIDVRLKFSIVILAGEVDWAIGSGMGYGD